MRGRARAMRAVLGALLVALPLLAGCATLGTTPYNDRLACESIGGRYTADGRCQAGFP